MPEARSRARKAAAAATEPLAEAAAPATSKRPRRAAAAAPAAAIPTQREAEPAHYADRDSAIESLPAGFLHCRDFGHSWKPYRATWNAQFRYYETTLRCVRCKTQRTRYIGPRGQLAGSKYEYADGYQMTGYGPMTGGDRDHIRLASIMHLLPNKGGTDDEPG